MIIINYYTIKYDDARGAYRIKNTGASLCPDCGQPLSGYDTRKRHVIDSSGTVHWFLLRRLYRVFDVPESTTPKYEVVIPSPTLLNQSNKVPITLSSNFLTPDEILNVSLDPSTFSPDGYLHLMSDRSDFLKAEIQRAGRSDTDGERIDAVNGPFIVAKFDNSSLNPVEYGSVIVKVIDDGTAPPNNYTGYLHFTFELSTKN